MLCEVELLWLVCTCEWDLWSEVGFDGSSVAVEVWVVCSAGCCVKYVIIVDEDVRVVVGW